MVLETYMTGPSFHGFLVMDQTSFRDGENYGNERPIEADESYPLRMVLFHSELQIARVCMYIHIYILIY